MARLLVTALIALCVLWATACGDVFVRATFGTPSTFQGTVSTVQFGDTLNGAGGTAQVTFLAFPQSGTPITIADQTSLFPLNQIVSVNFNPGQPCATVIVVAIVV